ncbi:hypothetical protein K438DRAFT_1801974 [Mycena galopus ATCC 62051]|nr:hypothetical protein K438DRAFT_1801974 [Mycena galopus ATCC 62051]
MAKKSLRYSLLVILLFLALLPEAFVPPSIFIFHRLGLGLVWLALALTLTLGFAGGTRCTLPRRRREFRALRRHWLVDARRF